MPVVTPGSTDEVAEVMRDAAARKLTVVPTGRGTKLGWGLPVDPDLHVDLSGMGKVLDHQAGDLIVDVQAGVRLSDLQQTVGAAEQRLLVDETVPGATIGGTVATNASGPRRLVAGTARDLLIGVTVVRADGVVARAGGRVVKNVAGYDLGKLMVGSFGTLAVVTEAVFRLHPVPEARRWVGVDVDTAERAHDVTHAVVHSQLVPAAVEVEWPAEGGGTVVVEIAGRSEGVARRVRDLEEILGGATVADVEPATWSSYPWTSGSTGLKLTCVLSGLRDVLTVAREVGAHVRGSSGAGVLYAALEDADAVPGALARLREVCARHEGTVVVVDAPSEVKRAVDVWGPIPALDLMRRVKQQFDPDHRLSPGRFVGGL
ncbi:FAD-binding oxidoreductase [Nocardioides sp. YIM 152315]|uniref:FAD-binding oxidoreductase n=1 Tax=Nocardioides sp. YIM 152315 TaxID=3031760 RepID=UPI0023DB8A73|nr:FAD-binding oxidoreductase [Nocardioides sp. YIM 152315]MDF1606067.1 FAD-binding oxidoreductase [Nocardioides sp. YIM 152315]